MAARYPCGVFLRKTGSLSELGHQGFLVFLVEDLVDFVTVRRMRLEKTNGLNYMGERTKKSDRENREW